MLNLNQLQQEVKEWSEYNFGDQSPELPLMGLIEEVGELAHAVLKTKQNIRAIETGAIEDAVGDIVIYYMDYLSRINFKIPANTKEFYGIDLYQMTIPHIGRAVGMICNGYIYSRYKYLSDWTVGHLLTCLATFCAQYDPPINFEAAVEATWNEVKQRDWKTFPTDGRTK